MDIRKYDSDLLSSNMYVIEQDGHAVVIDPSRDMSPGEGLKIDLLIVTHEHYDHISGVNQWKDRYGAPLLCSQPCAERIIDPKINQARYFSALYELQSRHTERPEVDNRYSCRADFTFREKLVFFWHGNRFVLSELPGHSPGSIGIYLNETNFFSGDSLLRDTEVELRFPGGNAEQWRKYGEPQIKAIPSGTTVWPGHFESFIQR